MRKYVAGFIIGMVTEYLLRVEFSHYPIIILGLMFIKIILDEYEERRFK